MASREGWREAVGSGSTGVFAIEPINENGRRMKDVVDDSGVDICLESRAARRLAASRAANLARF